MENPNIKMVAMPEYEDLKLDAEGTATYLGVDYQTLANWRWKKKGPQFVQSKDGAKVYYRISDLNRWLRSQRHGFDSNPDESVGYHECVEFKTIEAYPDGRLDPVNAAKYIGVTEGTLSGWRSKKIGPSFIKFSSETSTRGAGRVFYYLEDIDRWMDRQRVKTKEGGA